MRSELLLALAVFFAAPSASAFCRSTTVAVPPTAPTESCWTEGLPLYHPSTCIAYRLLATESPVIPNAILSEKLGRAFRSWESPNTHCTPGITGVELAPSSDAELVGYRKDRGNSNLVGVVSEWKHQGGADTLALSTLTFNAATGEILDVDVEVNGTLKWGFDDAIAPDAFDLEAALTHEVGHVFGFAHSPIQAATMFASYSLGSTEGRTLDDDDQQAICAVYPNRMQRLAAAGPIAAIACNLAAGSGTPSCSDAEILHGCAMTAPTGGTASGCLLATVALALRGLRRRRKP